jgi:hypothetical protein
MTTSAASDGDREIKILKSSYSSCQAASVGGLEQQQMSQRFTE